MRDRVAPASAGIEAPASAATYLTVPPHPGQRRPTPASTAHAATGAPSPEFPCRGPDCFFKDLIALYFVYKNLIAFLFYI
jgi:hypothetical protein